jgi:hypothetical protein
MNTILKTTKLLALVALFAAISFGQTALSTTTLGAAITDPTATTITLASTSTMLSAGSQNQFQTCLYVDQELMGVTAVLSSTQVTVVRAGCSAIGVSARKVTHQNGTPVWFANTITYPNATVTATSQIGKNDQPTAELTGSCTATTLLSLPRVYLVSGDVYDCRNTSSGGQWILIGHGTSAPAGSRISAFCTGTAGSAETEYLNFAACSGATTLTARQLVTVPGTLANLYVVSSANFTGGTGKDVATVFKNGSATTLTCTAAGATTTCSDVAHSVSVVPGDVLAVQFISATSDTAANVSASFSIF